MTAFRSASATDAGRVRSSNQDLSYASTDLVAVADGMGGHVGGEVAARLAVETLQRAFANDRSVAGLIAATTSANETVFEQSTKDPGLRGMGTTLTCAAIVRSGRNLRLVLANVGDSRAYLLRNGKLRQLTEDHSLVEEMVRNGELTPAQAAVHPHRHILTRALGIDRSVSVDTFELEPTAGTRLLLCSDGLTNECGDDEILNVLASTPEPRAAADRLVALALEHGGSDNVTVVVADIDPTLPSPVEEAGGARGRRGGTARTSVSSPSVAGAVGVASAVTATARPAPAAAPPRVRREPSRPGARRRRRRADRVLSVRVILFVFVFVAVLGGAAGAIGWWVKASYFVGVDHGYVAVYEGRPGGFLWFKPELLDLTTLSIGNVYPPSVAPLENGMLEQSLGASERVVANLQNEHANLVLPTVDTTGALGVVGTTTTLPPTTTTTTTTTLVPPTSPNTHIRPNTRRISTAASARPVGSRRTAGVG